MLSAPVPYLRTCIRKGRLHPAPPLKKMKQGSKAPLTLALMCSDGMNTIRLAMQDPRVKAIADAEQREKHIERVASMHRMRVYRAMRADAILKGHPVPVRPSDHGHRSNHPAPVQLSACGPNL